MRSSPWMMSHPKTSEEASAAARRSMRATMLVLVAVFVGAVLEAVLLRADPLGMVAIGAAVVAYCMASAQVHREAYHRLVAEGK